MTSIEIDVKLKTTNDSIQYAQCTKNENKNENERK